MKVLKFGGTSVGSANAIRKVLKIVEAETENAPLIVVVSAFAGITNQLDQLPQKAMNDIEETELLVSQIAQIHQQVYFDLTKSSASSTIKALTNNLIDICRGIYLLQEVTGKSRDFIMTVGELLSSHIIYEFFRCHLDAEFFNSADYIIAYETAGYKRADLAISKERLDQIDHLKSVNVFPGFIASTPEGTTTSLGRGGSDYTASILAMIMEASSLEIWTDVDGIMSADPKYVRQAKPLRQLSYEEALEISHFGAKVIYPPSIQPALSKGIPITIKNTFDPTGSGTLITKEWDQNKMLIQGISSIKNVVIINISGSGMMGIPFFSTRYFNALESKYINIILITQASSEHSVCIAISLNELNKALEALNEEFDHELSTQVINPIEVDKELAIVSVVGSNMKNQQGISGKMFHSLGSNGISVKAIAQGSSERNISAVIPKKHMKKALNTLHESFFLSDEKVLNLFIIGVGNVGKAFIRQIQMQQSFLKRMQRLNIRIVALANSKKMIFDDDGIKLEQWGKKLEKGEKFDAKLYLRRILELNVRNGIFIDITASKDISNLYPSLLSRSISVVTPNKLGATSPFEKFREMHEISVKNQVQFLYETNVAAGLPVVSTLKDLVKSGDRIIKIEAVLSGTLNYLFNTYEAKTKFVDVVKDAQQKGLTEPDPREDLLGEDVRRKILILARETGLRLEMDDVGFDSFLPKECLSTTSLEKFYQTLDDHEHHFAKVYNNATADQCKLRVVATLENKKPMVSLQSIPPNHVFYHLEGKDNIVLFYTNRYRKQPLVVKGAGAGADVTASGIFADILKISAN